MNCLNLLPSHRQSRSTISLSLRDTTVHSGQSIKVRLEARAERRIERIAGAPEGVPADIGIGDYFQRSEPGGLDFVCDIRVPKFDLAESGWVWSAR